MCDHASYESPSGRPEAGDASVDAPTFCEVRSKSSVLECMSARAVTTSARSVVP